MLGRPTTDGQALAVARHEDDLSASRLVVELAHGDDAVDLLDEVVLGEPEHTGDRGRGSVVEVLLPGCGVHPSLGLLAGTMSTTVRPAGVAGRVEASDE